MIEIKSITPLAKAKEATNTLLEESLRYTNKNPIKVEQPAKKVMTKGTIISPLHYMKRKIVIFLSKIIMVIS